MIQVNLNNFEIYKKDFIKYFGEDFIKKADEYIELVKYNQIGCKKYHPFFEYWEAYNLDIKQAKETNQLRFSNKTYYIFELLSNLKDLENKYNIERFVNNLLIDTKFYSTVFEVQTATLYGSIYELEILEETTNSKTPDLKINILNEKSIYVECKSLQDFEIENNKEYKKITDTLQAYCVQKHKSNQIIVRTGENFRKQYTIDILKEIKKYINQDIFGDFKLEKFNIEISNLKISDWDSPIYGSISVKPTKNVQFSIIGEIRKLFNGVIENKNIIMIGIESKPILNFEKRIGSEIRDAKQQIPIGELGIVHIQLPIHEGLNFEEYINNNYEELKRILKTKTSKINALIISNPIYNIRNFDFRIPNIQYYVIPNMNAERNINLNFKYPFTNFVPNNIPDLSLSESNSDIELYDIIYTPIFKWEDLPPGLIQLNLISSSGKTQFKIWKSYDKTITFDIIINGERICVKTDEDPFIINSKNIIDITIQRKNVSVYVNKKELTLLL